MRFQFSRTLFWRRVEKTDGCWERGGYADRDGYTAYNRVRAHRVAYELALGEAIPPGLVVGHVCDNPRCVRNDEVGTYAVNGKIVPRFGHLWLGTHQDNAADRHAKGRTASGDRAGMRTHPERFAAFRRSGRIIRGENWRPARGEKHGSAKLTEALVREIRRRYAAGGVSQRTLGHDVGVSRPTITMIVQRKAWSHVVD